MKKLIARNTISLLLLAGLMLAACQPSAATATTASGGGGAVATAPAGGGSAGGGGTSVSKSILLDPLNPISWIQADTNSVRLVERVTRV